MTQTATPQTASSQTAPSGLTFTVYRASGEDYSAGGVTSWADNVTLVGHFLDGEKTVTPLEAGSQVFPARFERPPVALHVRRMGKRRVPSLVPVTWDREEGVYRVPAPSFMFGGNYAALVDSKVSDLLHERTGVGFYGALAVHDRFEH